MEHVQLAAELLQHCRTHGWTLATCESLTGGLIGATLTAVAGASDVFLGGLITYAPRLKSQLAGVDTAMIARDGVVNRDTAVQMARGAAAACDADLAVSVTGVAGPGASDNVSAGTVWVGLWRPDVFEPRSVAERFMLNGDRHQVRAATVGAALSMALNNTKLK